MRRRRSLSGLGALSPGEMGAALVAAGVALYFLWPKSASAQTSATGGGEKGDGRAPGAGGGMPGSTGTFTDPSTGVLIDGPSTGITAPAVGAADLVRTVERGESWSNMASRAYNDYRWWPYIWDYNRASSSAFSNPDVLNRGDTVRIPAAPPADPTFQAAIFSRAKLHRDYWICKNAKRATCVLDASVTVRTPLPTQSMSGLGFRLYGLGYNCAGC